MTDRYQLARTILATNDIHLYDRTDPEWLETFPGGFTTSNYRPEALVHNVSLELITQHGAHLDEDEFVAFCEAISTWQNSTRTHMMLQIAPDLIVRMFAENHSTDYLLLSDIADRAGIAILRFLGAMTARESAKWDGPD